MPFIPGKKAGGDPQRSGGRKYSITGLFGQHRPSTGGVANRANTVLCKEPQTDALSSSPDNPQRTITPSVYLPRPNIPGDIQEAYESATHLETLEHPSDASHPLSETDIKYIFSGAPHFLLEKGQRSQWYPHVIFPWDDSASIQSLVDRKRLQHPAFTLSTLHAHIPVSPSRAGIQIYPDALTEKRGQRRPSFDIGVFEIPNMLSSRAKEDGCIGFRHYMELPIAYMPKPRRPLGMNRALDRNLLLVGAHGRHEPYSDYRPDITHDRLKLIAEGPSAWKRIGVRNCSTEALAERLQTLSHVRDRIVLQGQSSTLLDKENVADLHRRLFSTFLYPPPNVLPPEHPDSMRYQIAILTQVLGIKGAWIDFSLPEWRDRVGQPLWEMAPHQDGDCLNYLPGDKAGDLGLERKWLLIQLVLSAEALLRADAAAKAGIYSQSKDSLITPRDIYMINSLRNSVIDWSLIFSRRYLENIITEYIPQSESEPARKEISKRTLPKFSAVMRKGKRDVDSVWDCVLMPHYPWQQLEALLLFAEAIKWPDFEKMKHDMTNKLEFALHSRKNMMRTFGTPISTKPLAGNIKPLSKNDMYRRCHASSLIQLHHHHHDLTAEDNVHYLGGWMSRSWLTGLVMPGDSISDALISTVLENDPEAIKRVGPIANLNGGFIYKGRSWWSKMCVVGRILALLDESSICMGWIGTTLVPVDELGTPLGEGWLEIETINVIKNIKYPRIQQGTKVFLDSSPLGTEGDLTGKAFSLPIDDANTGPDQHTIVTFKNICLSLQRSQDPSILARPRKCRASLSFTLLSPSMPPNNVIFSLNYAVAYIASYPCLPPYGYTAHPNQQATSQREKTYHLHRLDSSVLNTDDDESQDRKNSKPHSERQYSRLPGHPLHTDSFPYSYIPLHTLPTTPFPPIPDSESESTPSTPYMESYYSLTSARGQKRHPTQRKHTYIIDATGSKDKELFARSWCAKVGTSAVVGRVGRTCLACCIRQARAVDVGCVIRVGGAGKCATT
ncbi:hypothetical protein FQN55_005719 [Onygenales sp. PD_40]|nr:hypothetical protein FQN55_005719 [Onygenales sp. PD_40]